MASTKYKKNSRGEYEARIWDGTYNADGTKHRKKLVSKKSSADLERKVTDFKRSVEEDKATTFSDVTFGEYSKQWLMVSKASKEKNTILMYNAVLSRLDFLHDCRMTDLQHSHFQQAINLNIDHPRACQQISLTMKQVIKAAVRDRILPKSALEDITTDISLPRYQKPDKRALTALEREAILNVILDDRKSAFLFLLFYCGLRRGEALALTRDDFDWEKRTVSITKALIFTPAPEIKPCPKSKNSVRDVPIPAVALQKIKPFVDTAGEGCLFRTQNGELMTAIGYRRMWDSIVTAINIAAGYDPNAKKERKERPIQGLTAHILRHNYCTELCYQVPAISTKMIARLLGDTEKMVLDVYSHIIEEKESVAEALDQVFFS